VRSASRPDGAARITSTPPLPNRGNTNAYAILAVPLLVYVTVGAFVASRRPRNLVGWMLCAIGFVFVAQGFGVAYADYVLLAQAGSPSQGGVYMVCISQSLIGLPSLLLFVALLILLFPDGHLPDRSLRAVPWLFQSVTGCVAHRFLSAVGGEDHICVGEQEPFSCGPGGPGVQGVGFPQPPGNDPTFDTRSLSGYLVTNSARISPVRSVERSLTAMTSNMPE
jgi:hypothetical protein